MASEHEARAREIADAIWAGLHELDADNAAELIATALRAAYAAGVEDAAQTASLEALRVPKKRTASLGLPRETLPHEYGNHIAAAIRAIIPAKED